MAKKITDRENNFLHRGWSENETPYIYMVDELTKGKSKTTAKKIISEFKNSHTYLLIADLGALSPPFLMLLRAYRAEQKEGLHGFVNSLLKDDPTFFD